MKPLVTIGMPTYNRADYLPRTINSILSQTFSDFELLIYDDGSSDNTLKVLESYNDKRINFVSFKNQGPPEPLNYIYKKASGEFIIILHDHDIFSNVLLEKCIESLQNNEVAGFVLPGGGFVDSDGVSNYIEMINDLPLINDGRKHLLEIFRQKRSFNSKFHACSMVRRAALEHCGFFYKKKYGFYSDVDLWIRLLKDFDFLYLKEPLIKFTRRASTQEFDSSHVKITNILFEIHSDNLKELKKNTLSAKEVNRFLKLLNRRYFYEIFLLFTYELSKGNKLILEQLKEVNTKNFNYSALSYLLNIFRFNLISKFLVFIRKLLKKSL